MAEAMRGLKGKALQSINDPRTSGHVFAGMHMEGVEIGCRIGGRKELAVWSWDQGQSRRGCFDGERTTADSG
jgi:hypothetical protein